MAAIVDFFKGKPDTPEVIAAKQKVEEAKKAAEASVKAAEDELEAAKNAPAAPATSGTAVPPGGRRRKHKGGKHTKRHTKSKKGKSRRVRSGRKSSRL